MCRNTKENLLLFHCYLQQTEYFKRPLNFSSCDVINCHKSTQIVDVSICFINPIFAKTVFSKLSNYLVMISLFGFASLLLASFTVPPNAWKLFNDHSWALPEPLAIILKT